MKRAITGFIAWAVLPILAAFAAMAADTTTSGTAAATPSEKPAPAASPAPAVATSPAPPASPSPAAKNPANTATVRMADGFDFPVGKPNAHGYHKARGFTPFGHLGEDWDGDGGGDTDLGDPVCSTANGIVVFAADVHLGWGNVVILRHCYYENGQPVCVDSLYGHLNEIMVKAGDAIARGQQVGTIGTAHGMYPAHLHFEIRKNLKIGMNRSAFAPDFSNYYSPTEFIEHHRTVTGGPETSLIAINTFSHSSTFYGGPTGVRFATSDYERASQGDSSIGHYRTLYFNVSSGDEPISVQVKSGGRKNSRHGGGGAFKVNRYDDIKLP